MASITCIEAKVVAMSSLTHNGGEKFGVTSLFRREKIIQPDGMCEEIPIISGNSIRGQLRDVGMYHMLRCLGYGIKEDGHVDGLSLAAFYLLFSGGRFTSGTKRGINLDTFRDIKKLIPLIGVFGGTLADRIMPGLLSVGKLIPICRETAHIIPEKFHLPVMNSFFEYLQEEMYVRTDDAKNDQYALLLSDDTVKLLADERQAKEQKQRSGDTRQDDVGQHQQMRYFVETLAVGTPFYWKIVLKDTDTVSYEAFVTTLAEFSKRATVGGKSAVGHGEIRISFSDWYTINTEIVGGNEIDRPLGTRYMDHLRDNAAAIHEALRGIV